MGNLGTTPKGPSRPGKRRGALEIWNAFVRGFEAAVFAVARGARRFFALCAHGLALVRELRPTLRALCLALAAVLALGAALSARPVSRLASTKGVLLKDDQCSVRLKTRASTVADLLSEYRIVLGEGDVIYPELSAPVGRGDEVMIRRAHHLSVTADGKTHAVALLNGTVDKALHLAGVAVDENDIVQPALDQQISPGMEITVSRVDIAEEVERRRIPYHITYQDDDDLYIGKEKMVKQGSEGVKEVTMRVVKVDGVETERTVVTEEVIEPARNRIVSKGVRPTPTPTPKPTPKPTSTPKKSASPSKTASPTKTASKTAKPKVTPDPDKTNASNVTDKTITIDGKSYEYSRTLTVMITAYTHTGRKTSTGVWPQVGTVAVDKSVIPYGTKLYIPGYGFGVAQDTGVSGNHIDVFFDTEAECVKYGRKRDRTIYILD